MKVKNWKRKRETAKEDGEIEEKRKEKGELKYGKIEQNSERWKERRKERKVER